MIKKSISVKVNVDDPWGPEPENTPEWREAKKVWKDTIKECLKLWNKWVRLATPILEEAADETGDAVKAMALAIFKGEAGREEALSQGGIQWPETVAFQVGLIGGPAIRKKLISMIIELAAGIQPAPWAAPLI